MRIKKTFNMAVYMVLLLIGLILVIGTKYGYIGYMLIAIPLMTILHEVLHYVGCHITGGNPKFCLLSSLFKPLGVEGQWKSRRSFLLILLMPYFFLFPIGFLLYFYVSYLLSTGLLIIGVQLLNLLIEPWEDLFFWE